MFKFHDNTGYPCFMLEFSFCTAERECSNIELCDWAVPCLGGIMRIVDCAKYHWKLVLVRPPLSPMASECLLPAIVADPPPTST
jgi:hypothetical protein